MKCFCAIAGVVLLSSLCSVRAAGPDEQYLEFYGVLQEADKLSDSAQTRGAVTKYLEAQTGLKNLQTSFPDWNTKIVTFRLQYITSRLEPLTQKVSSGAAGPAPAVVSPGQAVTNQLLQLQEDASRLANQNALLEAKLREALTVQPAASDPRELAKAEDKIKQLEKERDLLAVTLDQSRSPASSAPAAAAEELKKQIAAQGSVAETLRRQNNELQRQLADTAARARQGGVPAAASGELMELKETIAMLQASNRVMQSEQVAMETRLLDWVRSQGAGVDNQQLEALRAKIRIFEAKAIPYTSEELAFFKQPVPKATGAETPPPVIATAKAPAEKKRDEIPSGAGGLMAAADRAIDSGKYIEAEAKLTEILHMDEGNVYLLFRLAAAQLEQDKTAEVEANLKKALAIDPEHPASLVVLGHLKFRQEKYDEAIDALSMAAKIRPDRSETYFMLGRALIQKGNRGPAETALRKAIQLKPTWGEPHYQLAVLYATQQPGFPELAQYHYNKAIAGGVPRNFEIENLIKKPVAANK